MDNNKIWAEPILNTKAFSDANGGNRMRKRHANFTSPYVMQDGMGNIQSLCNNMCCSNCCGGVCCGNNDGCNCPCANNNNNSQAMSFTGGAGSCISSNVFSGYYSTEANDSKNAFLYPAINAFATGTMPAVVNAPLGTPYVVNGIVNAFATNPQNPLNNIGTDSVPVVNNPSVNTQQSSAICAFSEAAPKPVTMAIPKPYVKPSFWQWLMNGMKA